MLAGRQLNLEDYWVILRRRCLFILIPALLGPVAGYFIAKQLAPRYTSTSLILIEQPKVPASIVPSMVGNDIVARLANMQEQILSRSRLEPIIQRYGLYKDNVGNVPMELLVERMRNDIGVKQVSFTNSFDTTQQENQVPGFQISFTYDSPKLAQAVCSEITSMFVEENLQLRERRAEGTTNFIESQLQGAKQKLDEQDAVLAAFKRKYFGSLPDQEQSSIEILGTLSNQLNSLTDSIGRYQEDRAYTESLLDQQLAAWKSSQGGSPQTLQEQLAALENHLTELKTHYTDEYPDVIRAKHDIALMKQRIAKQEAAQKSSPKQETPLPKNLFLEPPQIRQLRMEIHNIEQATKENEQERGRVRAEIARYEGKVNLTPSVEQQYKDITRNYQTALDFYNSLLAKEDASQMSTSLERRQEGEQFNVLDPANLPHDPSYPSYSRFAEGGLAAGLLFGFAVVLVLEMRDRALRDERDIEYFLGVPTLALVPAVSHKNGRNFLSGILRRRKAETARTLTG